MNKTIGDYIAAVSVDGSTNYLLIQPGNSSTAYNKINRNVLLGISGQPADISTVQTFTNKVLDNTNTITIKDTLFTLQDDSDTTKQAKFQLSGITTATTRTYTLPNTSSTLADIATAQTFTNKTLTSPVISGGSIDNSTITVDSIAGHTSAGVGTIYGLGLSSGAITSSNAVPTAALQDSSVTFAKVSTGFCVQEVSFLTSTVATGSTLIPYDDTIPQNTEGDQYMTLAITPKATTNQLVIMATVFGASSASGNNQIVALFQDSTANALAVLASALTTAATPQNTTLVHTMAAGTTSATTFKIRVGQNAAGTYTFNGFTGARKFGGANISSIVITEYKA